MLGKRRLYPDFSPACTPPPSKLQKLSEEMPKVLPEDIFNQIVSHLTEEFNGKLRADQEIYERESEQ